MQSSGKKILLIEDEAFIADIYARELTKEGFNVRTEKDGPSGLKALEEDTYDLLLLDIMLPGMHGLELLRQWRLKEPNSTMPVLLLTNLGQDEVIKEAFTLGARGYLIKASYTPKQIVGEIINALSGKQAGTLSPS
ncbi:MAG: response regulator [Patescibacteria group bacterium]|nr:response regulator [Patescibacteria group bacterium]